MKCTPYTAVNMAQNETFIQNATPQTSLVFLENVDNSIVSDYHLEIPMSDDGIISENLTECIFGLRDKPLPAEYVLGQWELLRILFPQEYHTFAVSNSLIRPPTIFALPTANSSTTLTWSSNSPHLETCDCVTTTWSVHTPIPSVAINDSVTSHSAWQWVSPLPWIQPAVSPISCTSLLETTSDELALFPDQRHAWFPSTTLIWNSTQQLPKSETSQLDILFE